MLYEVMQTEYEGKTAYVVRLCNQVRIRTTNPDYLILLLNCIKRNYNDTQFNFTTVFNDKRHLSELEIIAGRYNGIPKSSESI